jgi:hypothetical protein
MSAEDQKGKKELVDELLKLLGVKDLTTLEEAQGIANQVGRVSASMSAFLDESKKLMQLAKSSTDLHISSNIVSAGSMVLELIERARAGWEGRAKSLEARKP